MGFINYGNFFIDIDEFEITEVKDCHFYNWDETPFKAVRLRKMFKHPVTNEEVEIIRWMSMETYNSMLEE